MFGHREIASTSTVAAEDTARCGVGDAPEQREFGADRLHQTMALGHRLRDCNQLGLIGKGARDGAAIRQGVHRQAVHRESNGTSVDRPGHDIRHLAQFVRCGLFLDSPLAHHIETHRAVADQARDVDAGLDLLDRIEVAAVVLPAPGQAGQDGVARDVLDRLHHAGQQFAVGRAAGRKGHAAVAQQRGGHPVPTDGRAVRVPADLGVEVRVDVDEAGRDRHALGIDLAMTLVGDLADCGDHPTVDANVSSRGFPPGPVDKHSAANDKVMGHGVTPRWGIQGLKRSRVWTTRAMGA